MINLQILGVGLEKRCREDERTRREVYEEERRRSFFQKPIDLKDQRKEVFNFINIRVISS